MKSVGNTKKICRFIGSTERPISMPKKKAMDAKDIEILNILQEDGRATYKDLASKIGLSESPTFTRVENLIKHGYITSVFAGVDLVKAGYKFFTLVEFNIPRDSRDEFCDAMMKLPGLLTAYQYKREEGLMREVRVYIHATFAHKGKNYFLDEMKSFLVNLDIPVDYRVYELDEIIKAFPIVKLAPDGK